MLILQSLCLFRTPIRDSHCRWFRGGAPMRSGARNWDRRQGAAGHLVSPGKREAHLYV